MGIFKSYDIRALYPGDWDRDMAYRIGFFLPELLDASSILVGRDARLSSNEIFDAVSRGICDAGADVVDIGLVSTPTVYFATAELGFLGSIMITASHNPAAYNGIKVSRSLAVPVGYDTGLGKLERMVDGPMEPSGRRGTITERNVQREYLAHLRRFMADTTGIRAVIDCSDGMAGIAIHDVARELAADCILMYDTPDGTFPHHEPNPLREENLRDLKTRVTEEKADLGICFDGDADRAMFVDEKGRFVSPDLITSMLARHFFRHAKPPAQPGTTVLYDIRSSRSVVEDITSLGGSPRMCKVGHSHAKKLLRETNGVMGGELSGHYYFRDNYFCDSGMIAVIVLLGVLQRDGKPFSELMAEVRRYHSSGEINFRVDDKQGAMDRLSSAYSEGELNGLDGIRIDFPTWWFNVRPSNTEPYLRLVVEASSEQELRKHTAEITRRIES